MSLPSSHGGSVSPAMPAAGRERPGQGHPRPRRADAHASSSTDIRAPGRPHHPEPFSRAVPGFFGYLADERGLRPATVASYRHYLSRFEAFLGRAGVTELDELSPVLLSAFVAERAGLGLAKTSVREGCGVLRVFLRYAHREGAIGRDLHQAVEWPQAYRLSTLPRSISWEDVGKVLAAVDRRTPCGKRDYAILHAAGHLWPAGPGDRGDDPGRHRLEARPAVRPRAQGRPFHRVPAVGHGRRCAGRLPAGRPPAGRGPARVLPGDGAGGADRDGCRLRLRPPATCCPPGSTFPARARTRCGTARSSGWWTPISRSRRSGTSSVTARRHRPMSTRRWPWNRCGRPPSVTARRCWDEPGHRRRRRRRAVPRPQAGAGTQVPQRRDASCGCWPGSPPDATPGCSASSPRRWLEEFLASRPRSRPRSFNHLLGVTGGFFRWAVTQELLPAAPLLTRRRRVTSARIPFLFDAAQARQLLDAAAQLPDGSRAPGRGHDLSRGLRPVLRPRAARRGSMRAAPGRYRHPPQPAGRCAAANSARTASSRTAPGSPPSSPRRPRRRRAGGAPAPERRCSASTAAGASIPAPPARRSTTLSRRSAWPCRTASRRQCCTLSGTRSRSGACCAGTARVLDPQARLLHLSTFMGHVDPVSTAVYLTITPQLLDEANRRFESFAQPAWLEAAL